MFEHLWRSPLSRARRCARRRRWAQAAAAYRQHLQRHSDDGAAWVQLGHSLKELGDANAAEVAYRRAIQEAPLLADAWVQVALLERRFGNLRAAVGTLERGIAVLGEGAASDNEELVAAMLALGARERLSPTIQADIERREGSYAITRYDAFRNSYSAILGAGPKVPLARPNVLAVIDARTASEDLVSATRLSLGNTPHVVVTDAAEVVATIPAPAPDWFLIIEGGARLDLGAIERLVSAAEVTGAGGAYCDYDHWENQAGGTISRRDPCFQPMRDYIWFRCPQTLPPCVLVTRDIVEMHVKWDELFDTRPALAGPCAHVPLILASRKVGIAPKLSIARPREPEAQSIQVVIQTRDAPDMLERCVTALLAKADRPNLLDVLIIDNRSVLPQTADLLSSWSTRGVARSVTHDEPFNWARANNLAVALGGAPCLLFLNNDVEIETSGWDTALRAYLADKEIGVVGARLLYPDRRMQHGGVIIGMGAGGPVHEGVGLEPDQPGPCGRWSRPRLAAAVTGAWLATHRSLFDAVGGFEERLPVAFNDIDFCLRCRAAERVVAQASNIVAVHRESATRGITPTSAEQDREHADWFLMREIWGEALELDPAYNPHWVRTGQPFDGIVMPSEKSIERWIVASARQRPWSIKRN